MQTTQRDIENHGTKIIEEWVRFVCQTMGWDEAQLSKELGVSLLTVRGGSCSLEPQESLSTGPYCL